DTLTVDAVPELLANIENGIAFTLGTYDDQVIEPMQKHCEAAREEYDGLDAHVQQVAESHFFKLRDYATLKYVRGCSGFAGFPKQSFSKEFIEEISSQMEEVIGKKWNEWGSEQVMSNIVI